eukprot:jgi/Psemu1/53319/gm1.53319_g
MSPSSSIIIQAETLQLNEVIIPQLYNDANISVADAEGLLKRPGKNGQVNGLVYCKDQMPEVNLHKGWKHVLRPPTDKTSEQSYIVTVAPSGDGSSTAGNIYVHYLPCNHKVVPALYDGRVGEGGRMVGAGRRVDFASSSRTFYKSNGKHMCLSQKQLRDVAIAFDNIARNTVVRDVYNWDIKCMKKEGLCSPLLCCVKRFDKCYAFRS